MKGFSFVAASARSRRLRQAEEQKVIFNRLCVALIIVVAVMFHQLSGAPLAQALVWETAALWGGYIAAALALQAHLWLWPRTGAWRQAATALLDAAAISCALVWGDAESAWLFPLYFWVILGNGSRLGPAQMGFAGAVSASGFAGVLLLSPFWRAHQLYGGAVFVSMAVIVIHGALLLRQLDDAHSEGERANRAKTLLLASVSHELRTPLTAILGLSALMQDSAPEESQREMARTISGAGSILLRHIEALLKVSRDEMDQDQGGASVVDLFALLADLRAVLAVEADKKDVRLGLFVEAGTPRYIFADQGLLLDIFQNLVGNAVKFTPSGAVALRVGLRRAGPAGFELRAEVRDTGIGVEKTAQKRIFDSFVQASPEIAEIYGGSGLGLAIARRRLESRGGRIGVESALGQGACFWFEMQVAPAPVAEPPCERGFTPREDWLPPRDLAARGFEGPQGWGPVVVISPDDEFDSPALARRYSLGVLAISVGPSALAQARDLARSLRAAAEPKRTAAPAVVAPPAGGLRILLAEDNGVNRMVLEKILTCGGHDVATADDGESALQHMLLERFDLILLDVNMPALSGVEATELYVLAIPEGERAPVLGLTADASAQRRRECLEAGMVDCLTKPILPEALLAAVAAIGAGGRAPTPAKVERLPGPPTLDLKAIVGLEKLGGAEFVRDLQMQFIGEGGELVEQAGAAVADGNVAAFRRVAHALESSAGNIGAAALAARCRSWNGITSERFALSAAQELEALREEWRQVVAVLNGQLSIRAA